MKNNKLLLRCIINKHINIDDAKKEGYKYINVDYGGQVTVWKYKPRWVENFQAYMWNNSHSFEVNKPSYKIYNIGINPLKSLNMHYKEAIIKI